MTKLELLLTIIMWIGYGVYAVSKTTRYGLNLAEEAIDGDDGGALFTAFIIIILSPIVLIYRCVYGIFRSYKI